jgi:hypothetical protein
MIRKIRSCRGNDSSRSYGVLVILTFLLAACAPQPTPVPEPSATASLTFTPPPTSTPTATPTASLTPEPDWYEGTDPAYSVMRYRYGLVQDPAARVYLSLADAVAGNGNFGYLPNAPAYVSVVGEETRDGRTYYTVYYGWMRAEDVQLIEPSAFRGLLLTRDVPFRFGWVLDGVQSVNAAGDPIQGYTRYQIVHEVPAVTENPGHVAVGPDEWLPEGSVALVDGRVPLEAGEICRFIHVDLSAQTLRVFDGCRLVFATLVSTGSQAGWTFPGRFGIVQTFPFIQLTPPDGSLSVYYLEGVPDFMTYSGDLGFHGAYWHDDFGRPVSHGCVNLSPGDALWLYEWAGIGEYVFITE